MAKGRRTYGRRRINRSRRQRGGACLNPFSFSETCAEAEARKAKEKEKLASGASQPGTFEELKKGVQEGVTKVSEGVQEGVTKVSAGVTSLSNQVGSMIDPTSQSYPGPTTNPSHTARSDPTLAQINYSDRNPFTRGGGRRRRRRTMRRRRRSSRRY